MSVAFKTEAFESIPSTGNEDVFVFGDHASKRIPDDMNNLGLSGDDLTRHIAWDIGTNVVVRRLCETFKCAGQLANFSRLVIDANRSEDAPGLIVEESDGSHIPGNQNLSAAARDDRLNRFHRPYHAQLGKSLDGMDKPFAISIHSFTPHPKKGQFRLVEIGLLARYDMESAEALREQFMRLGRNFMVGVNQPYSAYVLNHTVDTHIAPRGLRHLAIEVRQDHIDTTEKAIEIADILADRMAPIIKGTFKPVGA
jgi:predicted N-formylglutamate amidohydrolase